MKINRTEGNAEIAFSNQNAVFEWKSDSCVIGKLKSELWTRDCDFFEIEIYCSQNVIRQQLSNSGLSDITKNVI